MPHRLILAAGGAAATLLLMGGCGGGSSAFCDAVNDDMAASAVVFNPVVPGASDSGTASVEARLAFMDKAGEAPEGLGDEWTTFREYLEDAQSAGEAPITAPDDVDAARDALFDAQMECRE